MGMLTVNPNAEVKQGFPTVKPDTYRMRIVEVIDRNPEKNDLKVTLQYVDAHQLVLLDGSGYTGTAEGAGKLFDYIMLDHEKQWKLRTITEACGLPWRDYNPVVDLQGREVDVKVKIEVYNEEQRNKVDRYVV